MHIEVKNERGGLLVRDSLVAAFFSQRSYPELAKSFGKVFEHWLEKAEDDA